MFPKRPQCDGALGNSLYSTWAFTKAVLQLGILAAVTDLGPLRKGGVDRAVAVAGEVERLLHLLLVVLAVPAEHEGDLDLGESPRPILLLLALDLDRQ